jgi:hypothetical protein
MTMISPIARVSLLAWWARQPLFGAKQVGLGTALEESAAIRPPSAGDGAVPPADDVRGKRIDIVV